MKTTQNRGLTFFRTAGLLAVLVALLLPATANANDSIYWSREDGSNSIRFGPLTGSTPAQTLFDDGGAPCGIAANPAAGKIYWANWNTGEIRVANLDGTLGSASTLFAEPGNVCGVAVDPAAGKIYWANFSTNEIRVGNLNGTGTPLTLFTDPGGSAPSGVAIDPANNKIYWTNQFSDEVRAGNLDGSGFAQSLFSGEDNPIGVAADPAAGKIYWTDLNAGTVRVGPLGGSTVGAAQTLFNSSTPSGPAIDPTTNKIYWTSWTSGLGIRVGNRDGTGTVSTLFGGEGASLFAALVKAPVNTARPAISGGAKVGKQLTCQNGTWAPDLLASFLFRAPASFAYQWKLNGGNIATGPTFTPNLAGDYTCTVTATNQAGDTVQTSAVKKVKAQ
jgi:DNA-binding beta-propeller fold protein YncE